MTRVTVETVDHVARLARILLTEEERVTFARQLDDILVFAESIRALDLAQVEPMSHAGNVSPLREDVAREGLPRDIALAAAPDPADGLFCVPRVLA